MLNATPGVDLIFTLTRALQHGVRGGLAAAAGINAGCVVHAIAAAFGLAALLATSAAAFTALKLMGAVYLAWLAFGMLRSALDTRPQAGTALAAGMVPGTSTGTDGTATATAPAATLAPPTDFMKLRRS